MKVSSPRTQEPNVGLELDEFHIQTGGDEELETNDLHQQYSD